MKLFFVERGDCTHIESPSHFQEDRIGALCGQVYTLKIFNIIIFGGMDMDDFKTSRNPCPECKSKYEIMHAFSTSGPDWLSTDGDIWEDGGS